MKKVYSKPEIMFESFTLSTNIAGDCEVKTDVQSNNSCGMEFSGLLVFMEGMTGCADIQVDNIGGDGNHNGICYHTLSGEKNLFNS